MELNALLTKITSSIRTAVKKVCSMQRLRNPKISLDTERLIEERRRIDRDSPRYADLNRNVKKAIRRDGRSYNMQLIKEAIENSNMRVLCPGLLRGKLIHKMNDRGEVTVEKDKITGIIENFYRRLYDQSIPLSNQQGKLGQAVRNVGSQELQMIDRLALKIALKQLRNCKAPGEDLITSEMLKAGGETLEKTLLILLNKCLEEGKIPDVGQNAKIILLFKKGDRTSVENYRSINLFSIFYKFLIKIVITAYPKIQFLSTYRTSSWVQEGIQRD